MTTDIDRKRSRLLQAYPGYAWHEKVAGWSSEQVVAVFLRFERDGWPKLEINPDVKVEEPESKAPNDGQLPLF